MASSYAAFHVNYTAEDGVTVHVGAGVSVAVYDTVAAADVAESPLTTDSDGLIAAGSLAAVDPGTKIIFRVENYLGTAMCVSQLTT